MSKRILVAVDLSASSASTLATAYEVAIGLDAAVDAIHVTELPPSSRGMGHPSAKEMASAVSRKEQEAARRELDRLLSGIPDDRRGEGVIAYGNPVEEICKGGRPGPVPDGGRQHPRTHRVHPHAHRLRGRAGGPVRKGPRARGAVSMDRSFLAGVARDWGIALILAVVVFVAWQLFRGGGPGLGEEAPDFTLRTLDGESITLSELEGQTVVLNFWATWCGPCKAEIPELSAFQRDNPDVKLVVSTSTRT